MFTAYQITTKHDDLKERVKYAFYMYKNILTEIQGGYVYINLYLIPSTLLTCHAEKLKT